MRRFSLLLGSVPRRPGPAVGMVMTVGPGQVRVRVTNPAFRLPQAAPPICARADDGLQRDGRRHAPTGWFGVGRNMTTVVAAVTSAHIQEWSRNETEPT